VDQEIKEYSDGTVATGIAPLPELSPKETDREMALRLAYVHLDDIEAMYGRNGSTIQLRGMIGWLA
jgi:hypothetical protein